MIDLVKLHLIAGDGGHGRVSFRREKFIPKGGPDGGNGGNGGHVIIRGTNQLSTLQHLTGIREIKAQAGEPGGKRKKQGVQGADTVIEVPVGTVVWLLAENEMSARRRHRYGLGYLLARDEVELEKYFVEKASQGIPPRKPDQLAPILVEDTSNQLPTTDFRHLPKQRLVEITTDGQEVVICQGGFGGHGNTSFKGPARTTPLLAELGSCGEHKIVMLEQRLLADVGLVGFPSVGKSTLLSVLTEAHPKIGNDPFTTLEPQLGVMKVADRELMVADLPGLIEGASQGKGLGFAFLRHVEHCQVLLVVLALEEAVVFDEALTAAAKAKLLFQQWQDIRHELEEYGQLLIDKRQLIGINKSDLYDRKLQQAMTKLFQNQTGESPVIFSAATLEGIPQLKTALFR